jgi:hypothetical protein
VTVFIGLADIVQQPGNDQVTVVWTGAFEFDCNPDEMSPIVNSQAIKQLLGVRSEQAASDFTFRRIGNGAQAEQNLLHPGLPIG